MKPRWFGPHVAYTMAKYGMSMCVLGMAEEFRRDGIGVNALWPRTVIATAALNVIALADPKKGRKPEIMADAAHVILTRDPRSCTGNFFIDDEVLASAGTKGSGSVRGHARQQAVPARFLRRLTVQLTFGLGLFLAMVSMMSGPVQAQSSATNGRRWMARRRWSSRIGVRPAIGQSTRSPLIRWPSSSAPITSSPIWSRPAMVI